MIEAQNGPICARQLMIVEEPPPVQNGPSRLEPVAVFGTTWLHSVVNSSLAADGRQIPRKRHDHFRRYQLDLRQAQPAPVRGRQAAVLAVLAYLNG